MKRLVRGFFDDHLMDVVKGALTAVVLRAAGIVSAFVFNVIVARALGVDATGVFVTALTLVTVASVVGRAGLDAAIVRYVSAASARLDWATVKSIHLSAAILVVVTAGLVSVLLGLLSPWLAHSVFEMPDLRRAMAIMVWSILPAAVAWVYSEALRGIGRIAACQALQNSVIYAIACVVILAQARPADLAAATTSYLVAAWATLALAVLLWGKAAPQARFGPVLPSIGRLLSYGRPLFITQIMDLVNAWAGVLVLGVWHSEAEVGIFGMAARVALLAGAALAAINIVAAPKFATLFAQNDLQALATVSRRSAGLALMVGGPILLVFVVFSGQVMRTFGTGFEVGGPLLVILSLGHLVNVASGSVGYLLTMTGEARFQRNAAFFSAAVNVGLCLLLIPGWGGKGAAVALATSLVVQNLLGVLYVHRRLGFITVPLWKSSSEKKGTLELDTE